MLFLAIFGNNIEDKFRKVPYLLFYLFCGYVAAYGFAFANQSSVEPLVGASGAIAGVLGAYLVIYPRAKVWSLVPFLFFIPLRLPAWLVLGGWFVLQWAYSAGYAASGAGSVAYLAHVFGFLAGVVVGLILLGFIPWWLAFALIVVAIAVPATAWLMLDDSQRRRYRELRRRQRQIR